MGAWFMVSIHIQILEVFTFHGPRPRRLSGPATENGSSTRPAVAGLGWSAVLSAVASAKEEALAEAEAHSAKG